jgi:deoxycytidylate deaminase
MGDFPCDNCARFIIQAGIAFVVQEEKGKMHFYDINELVKTGRLR